MTRVESLTIQGRYVVNNRERQNDGGKPSEDHREQLKQFVLTVRVPQA